MRAATVMDWVYLEVDPLAVRQVLNVDFLHRP